jgi:hypothetical protein
MRSRNSLPRASPPLFAGWGGFFFAPPAFAAGDFAADPAPDLWAAAVFLVFAAGRLAAGIPASGVVFFTAIPENFVFFPFRVKEKAG